MVHLFTKEETHSVYVKAYEIYRAEKSRGEAIGICVAIQESLRELGFEVLTYKEILNAFVEFRNLKPVKTFNEVYWWSPRRGSTVRDQKFKLIINQAKSKL